MTESALASALRNARLTHPLILTDEDRWACRERTCVWVAKAPDFEGATKEHQHHLDEVLAEAVMRFLIADPVAPEGETPEGTSRRLRAEHQHLDRVIVTSQRRRDIVRRQMDEVATAARPAFPTDSHRRGIVEAARRIIERRPSGDPDRPDRDQVIRDTGVVVNPAKGWLTIKSHSPLSLVDAADLWVFTVNAQEEVCRVLRREGLVVREVWNCPGGMSAVVEIPSEVSDV